MKKPFPILLSTPEFVDPDSYLTWEEFRAGHPVEAEEYREFCRETRENLANGGTSLDDFGLDLDPDWPPAGDRQYFWFNNVRGLASRLYWCDAHYYYWHHYVGQRWVMDDDLEAEDIDTVWGPLQIP